MTIHASILDKLTRIDGGRCIRRLCQEAIDMLFKQGAEIRRMTR